MCNTGHQWYFLLKLVLRMNLFAGWKQLVVSVAFPWIFTSKSTEERANMSGNCKRNADSWPIATMLPWSRLETEREKANRDTTDGDMATATCPLHLTRVLNVFWQNPQLECLDETCRCVAGTTLIFVRPILGSVYHCCGSAQIQFRSTFPSTNGPMRHVQDRSYSFNLEKGLVLIQNMQEGRGEGEDKRLELIPWQGWTRSRWGNSQQNSSASPCAINRKVYRKSHRGLLYANSDTKLVRH